MGKLRLRKLKVTEWQGQALASYLTDHIGIRTSGALYVWFLDQQPASPRDLLKMQIVGLPPHKGIRNSGDAAQQSVF